MSDGHSLGHPKAEVSIKKSSLGKGMHHGADCKNPKVETGESESVKRLWSLHPMVPEAVKGTELMKTVQYPEPNPAQRVLHTDKVQIPAQLLKKIMNDSRDSLPPARDAHPHSRDTGRREREAK